MKTFALLVKLKGKFALDALDTEAYPLTEYACDAELLWCAVDKYIEVAVVRIFKRCHLEQLEHQLVGINAAAQVESKFEAAQIDLVAEVGDLL